MQNIPKGPAVAGIIVFALLLIGGIWWRTSSAPSGDAYSNSIRQREADPAFQRAVDAETNFRETNPEAAAQRDSYIADKIPVGERTNR